MLARPMDFDLVLKGGTLVDPAQDIHGAYDIGIRAGKIHSLAPDLPTARAAECLDVRGRILTPGLIDLHTHVAEAIMPLALNPDDAGVRSGVTAVCDAGSVGYGNYDAFAKLVVPRARTDVFCFLHLCPFGQAISPEVGWEGLDPDRVIELAERERETIVGIKIRANGPVIVEPELRLLKIAKEIGSRLDLPLMIHIGLNSEATVSADILAEFNRGMLGMLGAGDILTHGYTGRPGGILQPDESAPSELRAALARGVLIDAAPAKSHMSFDVARRALAEGIVPTTLSTDITRTNYRGPALFSLPVVMSKFLALGLSLEQVVEKTTIAPARTIGQGDRRGSLAPGRSADLTVFELLEGDFLFSDGSAGNSLLGHRLLEPRLCLKSGEPVEASSRFRDYDPDEPIGLSPGA